jgi:NTE family protein
MTMSKIRFSALLCALLALQAIVFPQPGPKVGVVLSGGGAKGYAHIGALRVLEEAGLRVDYIGGTSMGSIIGGLYAAGWPAWAMDSIIRETPVQDIIQDVLPRSTHSFLEKEYGEHYAFTLSLPDFNLHVPDGLSAGQRVYDFFSQLTIPVHHIRDFDELPIPFLCIGTDLETGEQIILREGFLPEAMRISGSLPILLAPVYRDGRALIDGGVVNNFPAKEVREMGADIIIGVTVQGDPYKGEELEQLDKLLAQITFYQVYASNEKQYPYCDYLIKPDIEGYTTTSFSEVDTLILRGERAARVMWDTLRAIARLQQGGEPQPVRRPLPVIPDSVDVRSVKMGLSTGFSKEYVLGRFEAPLPGKIAWSDFFSGIQNLKGSGQMRFIPYRFDGEGPQKELWLSPQFQNGYDKKLKVGIHYDDVYRASFLLNATIENALVPNGHASLDLILLDRFRYFFHYLIDNGRQPSPGFTSRLHFNEFDYRLPEPVYLDSALTLERIKVQYSDFSNSLYLRLLTSNSRNIGIGAEIKYFQARSGQLEGEQARRSFILEDAFYFTGQAYWKWDYLDDRHFPTTGSRGSITGKTTYPLSPLMQEGVRTGWSLMATFNVESAFALAKRWTVLLDASAGWTWGAAPAPYLFFLGGYNKNLINHFTPFPGLPFAAEGGSRLALGQAALRFHPWEKHYLSAGVSAAWLDDYLHGEREDFREFYSGFLRYSFRSPVGPIELTYALSNVRAGVVYFNLGYWF